MQDSICSLPRHIVQRPYDRVAHTMGVMVRGVRQMVHRATTSSLFTLATPITPTVFDNFAVGAIWRHIHRRFANKQHLTLSVLSTELRTEEWVIAGSGMDTTQAVTNTTYSQQVPPEEGERFVVVAGGTAGGFVEGSYLCYPAKYSQGDYHGEMNDDLFQRWLTTHLLLSLPEPSVLVLDNAPISIPPAATRRQLLLLCRQNRPEPQYKIENTIHEWGHEVVQLPPGHPELNAIEQVWGCMKRHVHFSLQRFTRADLQARLGEAKQLVNKDVWLAAVRHSQNFEKGYWRSDNIHEGV
ncbi:hypothetical protein E2C01_047549 [Portunus trituberculatus]|uniref:Tc1-like transposase DDE domain-containing protein n=1 Tax=Portunus trituberculatus TaxID=210409 RepID=A0A5B7G1F0_PORTR|nr:hypothetical protein [Portunus trituberculatus]